MWLVATLLGISTLYNNVGVEFRRKTKERLYIYTYFQVFFSDKHKQNFIQLFYEKSMNNP